jgi:hypothetical protein
LKRSLLCLTLVILGSLYYVYLSSGGSVSVKQVRPEKTSSSDQYISETSEPKLHSSNTIKGTIRKEQPLQAEVALNVTDVREKAPLREIGKNISKIEFPEVAIFESSGAARVSRIEHFLNRARAFDYVGKDLQSASAWHNSYLANRARQPGGSRNLADEKEVYDSLLFYTLLACWAESSCDEFVKLVSVPAYYISATELLTWTIIESQISDARVQYKNRIDRMRSEMTQKEIDIAEYRVSNFLFYKNQNAFDFPSFIGDYYAY